MRQIEHRGLLGFRFERLGAEPGLRHVFGARAADGSGNLSLSGGRDRAAALRVRAGWSDDLALRAEDWVVGSQVHGAVLRRAGALERGRGASDPADVLPPCDGLWTTEAGLPLFIAVADCGAVLLYRTAGAATGQAAALAVVHAGWRGLAAGIVGAAVDALGGPQGLLAGIAPCAGWDSYEVGEEVASAAPEAAVRRGTGRPHVDIGRWAEHALREAGLQAHAIERAGIDSIADPRCFSHRREGAAAGRMGLIAALAPPA